MNEDVKNAIAKANEEAKEKAKARFEDEVKRRANTIRCLSEELVHEKKLLANMKLELPEDLEL